MGAATGERWDCLFCSDMLNLAELKGLAPRILGSLPSVLYFHENQLTYPVQVEKVITLAQKLEAGQVREGKF